MRWIHNILKGVSLTGALFVFQACYGLPQDPRWEDGGEAPMTFSLVSKSTGEPLKGIQVLVGKYNGELGTTGEDGSVRVSIPYFRNIQGPDLHFVDPEGVYAQKDTSLADLRDRTITISMEKQ